MLLIIQAETADSFDVFPSKRSQEKAYILIGFQRAVGADCLEGRMTYGDLFCHIVSPENIPFDHAGLLGFADISDTLW